MNTVQGVEDDTVQGPRSKGGRNSIEGGKQNAGSQIYLVTETSRNREAFAPLCSNSL